MENSYGKISEKEQRIRDITHLYYSKPEIQKAIFDFSKNREVVPRYFEGFGKRPDSLEYKGDVFELVKKGATSFHVSEELWTDPLKISTSLSPEQFNDLRQGWDLLIDIDCKWFEYSKIAALSIIKVLNDRNLKNIGIKFSGSKGWHILVPWKAFPEEVSGQKIKNFFPEIPRKIVGYIRYLARDEMKKNLPENFHKHFKNVDIKRGIKCNQCNEIAKESFFVEFICESCGIGEDRKIDKKGEAEFKCPNCFRKFEKKSSIDFYECTKCNKDSKNNPENFNAENIEEDLFDLMGLDLILVSPRHLFRAPYSLHEKTRLASVVLEPGEIKEFQPRDANPLTAKIRNFLPEAEEGEASELLREALDWHKNLNPNEEERKSYKDFKPINVKELIGEQPLSDKFFPPAIKKVLLGVSDGRKRAVFILLNFFRSIGMDRKELEDKIYGWNKKNSIALPEGYIRSQMSWSYRKKSVLPPNFDKDYYKGIGIYPTQEELRYKNPANYTIKKIMQENAREKDKKEKVKKRKKYIKK